MLYDLLARKDPAAAHAAAGGSHRQLRAWSSMRAPGDADRVRALARRLVPDAREETVLYLTAGATAVMEGWRATTIDVDVRVEPDSNELLRLIASLNEELDLNVELAARPNFVPELPLARAQPLRPP